jgi:hypothetical protein
MSMLGASVRPHLPDEARAGTFDTGVEPQLVHRPGPRHILEHHDDNPRDVEAAESVRKTVGPEQARFIRAVR